MNQIEEMLIDKRDALKAAHAECVKIANRIIAQLSDVRTENAFLSADTELVLDLARQLHDRQEDAVGIKRDIKDLQQRALDQ